MAASPSDSPIGELNGFGEIHFPEGSDSTSQTDLQAGANWQAGPQTNLNPQSHSASQTHSKEITSQQLHLCNLASTDCEFLAGNLQDLYTNEIFWCTLGSDCTIALNPNESDSASNGHLYTGALAKSYAQAGNGRGAALSAGNPAHIFAVASNAYWQASSSGKDQSVFCVGASGTGKSENCKLLLQQLVYSSKITGSATGKKQVLNEMNSSIFLLDCFSNGACEGNFNSSASACTSVQVLYGKVQRNALELVGFKFETLFWDMERSVQRAENTANFHIFYYLLAGLPDDLLHSHSLTRSPAHYKLLSNGIAFAAAGEEAAELFDQMTIAMKNVGLGEKKQNELFAALGGLLHLGNVEFEPEPTKAKHALSQSTARIRNHTVLVQAARLLCVTEEDLEIALLQSICGSGGETCSRCLDVAQAEQKRNFLVASIYASLRLWILNWLNGRFRFASECEDLTVIRIVDTAFATELVPENCSLGAFCQNLAYEKTLETWNKHLLNDQLEAYAKARIDCKLEPRIQSAAESESAYLKVLNGKVGDNSFVSVKNSKGKETKVALVDSPLFLCCSQGVIHSDMIDLLKESGNSLLRNLVLGAKTVVECVNQNTRLYRLSMKSPFELYQEIFNVQLLDSVHFVLSLSVAPVHAQEAVAFDRSFVAAQLAAWNVDNVLARKKAAFDVVFEEPVFFDLFADIFEALDLPLDTFSVNALFSELQIPLKMVKRSEQMVFIKFDALLLIEECFQDIPSPNNNLLLGLDPDEELEINDSDHFAFQRQPSPAPSSASTALLSECNWTPTAPKKTNQATASRRRWLFFTRMLTWWVPDKMLVHFGGMEHPEVRIAWREKLALCVIICIISIFMLFNVLFLAKMICPTQKVFTWQEIMAFPPTNPHVVVFGKVYNVTKLLKNSSAKFITDRAGTDISGYFKFEPRCNWSRSYGTSCRGNNCENVANLKQFWVGDVGDSRDNVLTFDRPKNARIIIRNKIYDISPVVGANAKRNINASAMPSKVANILTRGPYGCDRTQDFGYSSSARDLMCMEDFFSGVVDQRNSFRCKFAENLLLGSTFIIVAIMFIKFISALRLPLRRDPEQVDKYVIMQVPCYTENEQSLRVTIDSLASLEYEDKKKLLFIVCDGMLIGSGNDRPTPRIVLDILGVPASLDPEPFSYFAIAEGARAVNQCKCYSGLYRLRDHTVPFVVLAKCGAPGESTRPGNRGKRDSQMILLNFLNHLYYDALMTPLEIELTRMIRNVIGVDPKAYEFVLQVDADTEVYPDSLTMLVSALNNDSKIIGLCGETEVGNEKASLITMIQVYEYYISHHLAKAFESLFGTVTCLPGCFSIFRIRSVKEEVFLVADSILREYSDTCVNTLHKKNLLHLGEDRFLTTLLIKNFPYNKLCFIGDAKCKTIVPDSWQVLKSQRRRWINSTVHNLFELLMLDQLCGFCLFSMRFVVCIDLFATIVMPATVFYLVYLVVSSFMAQKVPIISLLMFGVAYAMQALIFMIRGQMQHIGWMLLNILSMPIFNLYIPLYSFWHFDDFSWGNTRRVVGEDGKVRENATSETVTEGQEELLRSIPQQKLSELLSEGDYGCTERGHDPLALSPTPNWPEKRKSVIMKSSSGATNELLSSSALSLASNQWSRPSDSGQSVKWIEQQVLILWREYLVQNGGGVPGSVELKAAAVERLVRGGVAVTQPVMEVIEAMVERVVGEV